MGDYITTYTGRHFYPLHPNAKDLYIEDIAHALSLTCRGNGHVKQFFSVGEHCINCAYEAEARGYSPRVILGCLLHDASESYMSDVPTPFKQYLKDYQRIEEQLLSSIFTKFLGRDMDEKEWEQIKEIDRDMLAYDLFYLLGEGRKEELPELKGAYIYGARTCAEAEAEYKAFYFRVAESAGYLPEELVPVPEEEKPEPGCGNPVRAVELREEELSADAKQVQQVCFMNMCMITDGKGNVVALDKVGDGYAGTTFPGGHAEPGETFAEAVIREVKEETGLTIRQPVLRGIYHWMKGEIRQITFLYRTDSFEGELVSSREGRVYWISEEAYAKKEKAEGMDTVLLIMNSETSGECCFSDGAEKIW